MGCKSSRPISDAYTVKQDFLNACELGNKSDVSALILTVDNATLIQGLIRSLEGNHFNVSSWLINQGLDFGTNYDSAIGKYYRESLQTNSTVADWLQENLPEQTLPYISPTRTLGTSRLQEVLEETQRTLKESEDAMTHQSLMNLYHDIIIAANNESNQLGTLLDYIRKDVDSRLTPHDRIKLLKTACRHNNHLAVQTLMQSKLCVLERTDWADFKSFIEDQKKNAITPAWKEDRNRILGTIARHTPWLTRDSDRELIKVEEKEVQQRAATAPPPIMDIAPAARTNQSRGSGAGAEGDGSAARFR